jgi:hypothetical protein
VKKEDSERATLAEVTFIDLAMSGKPGKYMSIENGTMAVKRPSNKIVSDLLFLVITLLHKLVGKNSNI